MTQYISKYSNGKKVGAAQYITEIVCENKARMEDKDLHYRFWVEPYWEKYYKNQIASAHKLVKKYDANCIAKALTKGAGRRIFSLRAKHLIPLIEIEEKKLSLAKSQKTIADIKTENIVVKKHKNKKNILDTLEDLDNG